MFSGAALAVALTLIAAWFALLCVTLWKLPKLPPAADRNRQTRRYLTAAGIGSSTVAVGALLALHLSWISPDINRLTGKELFMVLMRKEEGHQEAVAALLED